MTHDSELAMQSKRIHTLGHEVDRLRKFVHQLQCELHAVHPMYQNMPHPDPVTNAPMSHGDECGSPGEKFNIERKGEDGVTMEAGSLVLAAKVDIAKKRELELLRLIASLSGRIEEQRQVIEQYRPEPRTKVD
jgi:uncharacterized coiled-coil protein SlyX